MQEALHGVLNSGFSDCFSKFYTAKNVTCLLIQDSSDIFGLFFVFSLSHTFMHRSAEMCNFFFLTMAF